MYSAGNPAASRTLRAAAHTSGPMPSPGSQAMRYMEPPLGDRWWVIGDRFWFPHHPPPITHHLLPAPAPSTFLLRYGISPPASSSSTARGSNAAALNSRP